MHLHNLNAKSYQFIPNLQSGIRGHHVHHQPIWDDKFCEEVLDKYRELGAAGYQIVSPTIAQASLIKYDYDIWVDVPSYYGKPVENSLVRLDKGDSTKSHEDFIQEYLDDLDERRWELVFELHGNFWPLYDFDEAQSAVLYCFKGIDIPGTYEKKGLFDDEQDIPF